MNTFLPTLVSSCRVAEMVSRTWDTFLLSWNIFQIASFVEPEFYFTGRYYNLAYALRYVMVFFKASNFSFNFFIYCNMSTRYRETLSDIFRQCVRKRKETV